MSTIEFHDQQGKRLHDEFQVWRKSHPDSFFLTYSTKSSAQLHATPCWHIGGVDWDGYTERGGVEQFHSITKNRKVCSSNPQELLALATKDGVAVKFCSHCLDDEVLSYSSNHPTKVATDSKTADFESANADWSHDELSASVKAYMQMQLDERDGRPYVKKQIYTDLSARFGRSVKAFEYRMQNISYVMSLMGRDWISGLKPAKNVGKRIASEIEELIAKEEGTQASGKAEFEITVREEMESSNQSKPSGNEKPNSSTSQVTSFQRDPKVKAWVLKESKGKCECCSNPSPFNRVDGVPYLEVHHIRQLADGGSDKTENAVALCPNCHRELHYGLNSKKLVESLYKRVVRLVRE